MIFVLGPHLPPGKGSSQAAGQVTDNTVLMAVLTPIICLIVVYFAYALSRLPATRTRDRGRSRHSRERACPDGVDRSTSAVVLFLAGYGTWTLLQNGSGGGQGPTPIAVPRGPKLPVQVIAQQWEFTYRYPTYGGLEASQLMLPENRLIEFHVTSLDAVHSFWAYGLGVKADANLGTDNVVYVNTRSARNFDIHCAELCGLWHGYMYDTGHVVSTPTFTAWVTQQQKVFEAVARYMPPYRTSYSPMPQRRAG